MRLVLLSDTHMHHESLTVPPCDVLIHAGDFTGRGRRNEVEEFLRWFSLCEAREKVLIAGNHDFLCEEAPDLARSLIEQTGARYLQDEEALVAGLRIWGSPITPRFGRWAFNRDRGPDIAAHWKLIPEGLDILITHGPPHGLGDRTWSRVNAGCEDLLARVRQVQPRLHVFGHIHEAHGEYSLPGLSTRFLNVANCRLMPFGVRPPIVVDLEPRPTPGHGDVSSARG
ncbi:metallophosphatase domain-containing protein [Pyxidicoccus parkwayensis]|uniref:Metallophosphatase domain-containing protein n=1 Tax=Pyxidicoccus parkwayensis TaxID=2813578 RepID=A0ABX7NRI5_9BACT|nr:metallophosphatase domain-containing protein [Pyxidicoccus parkwaysis]QSQ21492.1 metallophosphatase domain-containing protein [Pyxidicoccus parkwaysis]